MSLSPAERETVITFNDEDETAHVWTAQRPVITKLRKNPSAVLLEEGRHDGTAWARFELPASLVSFRSKRMSLSPEERKRRGKALREAVATV